MNNLKDIFEPLIELIILSIAYKICADNGLVKTKKAIDK